ncbi:unnamed protein product [Ascophyllum nodosum]
MAKTTTQKAVEGLSMMAVMLFPLALVLGLGIVAPSMGGDLVAPRNGLPSESRVDVVPVTGRLQLTERRIPKLFSFGQLQALNNTSSFSEVFSLSSTSSSTVASTPTGSCTESVDGVSVTSRVVVNGSRFGACYSNVTFSVNDYPAYFTSQIEDGLVVRGEEGLFVWQLTTSNETSYYWVLTWLKPDGLESDRIICRNNVDASSAGIPTSTILDGQWGCDVNGDGQYDNVDDIQVDCGCSAGTDAEEYYTCQEYEDLALNSYGGIIFSNGASLDGCYKVNTTMISIDGYHPYFAGPVEDGVATLFVRSYANSLDDASTLLWSVGIYYENGVDSACLLDAEVLNTTVDSASPLSDGNWFCDLDSDGRYEPYDGDIDVQCACIDETYTTCFEYGEGISLDSSIVFDGEHIRGCYLPTRFLLDDARVFTPTGEKETAVGALQVVILPHEDAAINFDDKVWTVARVHEYDEDTQVITFEVICLTLIPNVDLPTDPLLQGEWLCLDASGQTFTRLDADFDEMKCGCRGNASSSSSSIPVPSSTPTPTQDAMATTSNILFPTSTMEGTPTPVRTFLSPTRLPVGTGTNTEVVATEDAEQATPIGIIVGGSIGGVILVAGVVTMFLCARGDSQRRVGHIRHSPKVKTSNGDHSEKTRVHNLPGLPQTHSLPSVNRGRPLESNDAEADSIDRSPLPRYEDTLND